MNNGLDQSGGPAARMTIAIAGSSGFIGSALATSLREHGHVVRRLVRRLPRGADEVAWNPARGELSPHALDGVNAVVNLSGENLARRWTARARREIRDSRVQTTALLASAMAGLSDRAAKPRVLLNGSAVGIYGAHRGDDVLDESSTHGSDFLARTAEEWEGAAARAEGAGVRVVYSRTGLVLAAHGGVLAKLLLPFRLGVGGRIGNGRQWMSWITLRDAVRALEFLLTSDVAGPVNVVAPHPVTNAEFTTALGRAVHRPTLLPVPGAALTLALGQMARDTVLASQRGVPKRLLDSGFQFENPEIAGALRRSVR